LPGHRLRAEYAHARLIEQPIEQPLARQRRIEQLVILDGRDQRLRLDPGIVLGHRVAPRARGRVARIEIGARRARGLARQELHQQAAGPPFRRPAASLQLLAGEPDLRRNLPDCAK
jgi:hypothetical protein